MQVKVLEGQRDVTERDLGALQEQLKGALAELSEAAEVSRKASMRESAARAAVSEIQKKIDDVLTGMRADAPWQTKWSDDRRQGGPA